MFGSQVVHSKRTKRLISSLLCTLSLSPLAAQNPKPTNLASPLPPIRPLLELVDSERGREVERLLAAGNFQPALGSAQTLLFDEATQLDAAPSTVAADFALLALAQAGSGGAAGAICRWHAAQAFDNAFIGADLSAYGEAGQLLETHPLEDLERRKQGPPLRSGTPKAGTALPSQAPIERPELVARRGPQYTLAARKARVTGTVILEAVIGTDGAVSHLRVLQGLPLGLTATSIDAVCDWRFKPARRNDEPVEVYYVLTVNYQLQADGPLAPVSTAGPIRIHEPAPLP